MFLAHDLGDKVVHVKNTQNMAAKLKTVGDIVETHYYTGLNHALLMGAVATPLRFLAPVFKDLVAFIDAHTSAQPAKEKAAA